MTGACSWVFIIELTRGELVESMLMEEMIVCRSLFEIRCMQVVSSIQLYYYIVK